MKVNAALVKLFEDEQKRFGTKVALGNFLVAQAHSLLKAAGVKNMKLTYFSDKK